jgi:glycosyltransferase involved in cell wall biosynthesis
MDITEFKKKYEHKKVVENENQVSHRPIISVCVQTYQHVNYIKQCLDGILNQKTDFDFEILLGEDASKDGTREICMAYAENYPDKIRLFLHHRENNISIGGQPTGRFNFLFNLYSAKGKYIAMCEGDDYWTDPLKLQKQVEFLEENKACSFCFTKAKKVFEEQNGSSQIYPKNINKQIFTASEYLDFTTTATCSVLFKNLLKLYDIKFPVLQHLQGDFILYCHLLHYGKAGALDEVTCVYRKHAQGVSYINNAKHYLFNRIKQLKVEENYFISKEVKAGINKQYVLHINKFLNLYPEDLEKVNYLRKELLLSRYYYKLKSKKMLVKIYKKLKSLI